MNEKAKKRILFVDDEPMVLKGLQRTLRKMRSEWDMVFTASGKEALDVYRDNKDRIGLVVLDMIMPGMGAGDTYDELQAFDPSIKVLLSSGYGVDHQTSEILQRGCKGFVQKPFNMQVLSEKINEVLQ